MDEHKHTQHTHTDHTPEAPKTSDPHAGHDHSGHHMPPPQSVAAEPKSDKHASHVHTDAQSPHPKQAASQSHEQHAQHMEHGPAGHSATGHAGHHEQMVADYRKRFWIVLLLTLPVTLLSPMIMMLFGYHFDFPGANFIVFGLSTVIFFYGGKPFSEGCLGRMEEPVARHDDADFLGDRFRLYLQHLHSLLHRRFGLLF